MSDPYHHTGRQRKPSMLSRLMSLDVSPLASGLLLGAGLLALVVWLVCASGCATRPAFVPTPPPPKLESQIQNHHAALIGAQQAVQGVQAQVPAIRSQAPQTGTLLDAVSAYATQALARLATAQAEGAQIAAGITQRDAALADMTRQASAQAEARASAEAEAQKQRTRADAAEVQARAEKDRADKAEAQAKAEKARSDKAEAQAKAEKARADKTEKELAAERDDTRRWIKRGLGIVGILELVVGVGIGYMVFRKGSIIRAIGLATGGFIVASACFAAAVFLKQMLLIGCIALGVLILGAIVFGFLHAHKHRPPNA